jgi:probable addiction module antidote protein
MPLETRPFDPAAYLTSAEARAEYLTAALERGDAAEIAESIGTIARAAGMSDLARQTGLKRQSLYQAFSRDGNPEFASVLKVMAALGVQLTAKPLA